MATLKKNTAFCRALLALSHPVSILAIIIVLLNDHWWRRVTPSWFTGKIGDFAWLIFAPFLLALLLACLMPRREQLVGYAAVIGTGLIFGLAKTVPAFHALTIAVLEFLTGWPNVLRLDPTDLLAVPALLLAGWIWRQAAAPSIRLPNRGWVLLPLAVLATMADQAAQDFGICSFKITGSVITTRRFTSQDGGLTWQAKSDADDYCSWPYRQESQWQLIDPSDERIRYRFTPGISIERSGDGGQSWAREIDLKGDNARASYQQRAGQYIDVKPAGPIDAIIHQPTGNIIAAMGHEGALVRTPDGVWRWVAVGEYHVPDLTRVDNVVVLLSGEILLALALFALAAGTLTLGVPSTKNVLLIFLMLGWLVWLGTLVIASPGSDEGMANSFMNQAPILGAVVAAIFAALVAIVNLINVFHLAPKAVWLTIGLSVLTALLFLVPFLVWSQGGIPFYTTAMLYALVLVAVTLIAGRLYLRRFINKPPTLVNDTNLPV